MRCMPLLFRQRLSLHIGRFGVSGRSIRPRAASSAIIPEYRPVLRVRSLSVDEGQAARLRLCDSLLDSSWLRLLRIRTFRRQVSEVREIERFSARRLFPTSDHSER